LNSIFFLYSFLFWFVLLALAILNAGIRENTYKRILQPVIGKWAHQISALTAITMFFLAMFVFFSRLSVDYSRSGMWAVGLMWMCMTFVFECVFGRLVRKSSWREILETYYFWKGELWIFVLLSVAVMPRIIYSMLEI